MRDERRTILVLSEPLHKGLQRIYLLLEDITSIATGMKVYLNWLSNESIDDVYLRMGFLHFELTGAYRHAGHSSEETEDFEDRLTGLFAGLIEDEELRRVYKAAGWEAEG